MFTDLHFSFLSQDDQPSTSDHYINDGTEDSNAGSWIDQDFSWKEYLSHSNDKPASERLFRHVGSY